MGGKKRPFLSLCLKVLPKKTLALLQFQTHYNEVKNKYSS